MKNRIKDNIENTGFFKKRYNYLLTRLFPEGEWTPLKEAMIQEEIKQYTKFKQGSE